MGKVRDRMEISGQLAVWRRPLLVAEAAASRARSQGLSLEREREREREREDRERSGVFSREGQRKS